MVKIDLITGFLGSGKTTFLKKYAQYCIDKGENIGILENDHGAVNVDMMLLQDIAGEKCTLEMVAGGCDADCHKRRFKTKLIAMGMSGYDRVIVEPSGIFDTDEFFDVLHEEPIDRWYEIGSVITIVEAGLFGNLSEQSAYLLASQAACAGCILMSKTSFANDETIVNTKQTLNSVLSRFKCKPKADDEIITKNWDDLCKEDYERISTCGYHTANYVKAFNENNYSTLYFMNRNIKIGSIRDTVDALFRDKECGNIIRIKGFIPDCNNWYELNATESETEIKPITKGQEIVIVIGENLNENQINKYL